MVWLFYNVNRNEDSIIVLAPAIYLRDTLPTLAAIESSLENAVAGHTQSTFDLSAGIHAAIIEPDKSRTDDGDADPFDLSEYPDFIARLLEEQRLGNRSISDLRGKLQVNQSECHWTTRWRAHWSRLFNWMTFGAWSTEESEKKSIGITLSTADVPLYVLEYAPYCWLYSGESYWPTRLETLLDHTHAFYNYTILPEEEQKPTLDNLASSLNHYGLYTYLTSDDDPDSYPYWMEGTKFIPDEQGFTKAECYLVVVDKGDYVDAFWFFFYAFNLGNQVLGVRFGNHVGDWEHTAIRFNKKTGKPENAYFSAHEWGAAFWYKDLENSRGGKRPYTYSAVGSHAMYPTAGEHDYVLPFKLLKDVTDRGYLWDPLQNLRMYVYAPDTDTVYPVAGKPINGDDDGPPEPPPSDWIHYVGHWGDKVYPLDDPRQWYFIGELHYTSGPTGPKDKQLDREYICLNPGDCIMEDWPPRPKVISDSEWERYRTIR